MDLPKAEPKAILSKTSTRLLLLLTCLFVNCASTREYNLPGKFATFKRVTEQSTAPVYHERFRRQDVTTGSCGSKRHQCTGNTTVFQTGYEHNCYCDEACYKMFSDCCPDYERHCGLQESREPEETFSNWKCIEFGWSSPTWPCKIDAVTGVWMIYKCLADWPVDELRRKCENAPSNFSYPVEDFVPVVGANALTYRNGYCALCNGLDDYTAWNIGVFTYVIPPEDFDLDSRLKFIVENGGEIQNVSPQLDQPRRLCFGRNFIDNCNFTNDRSYRFCVDGPVEVVAGGKYYKNDACAVCNGVHGLFGWRTAQVCSPVLPAGFSVVFNLKKTGEKATTTVVKQYCPSGTVYDTSLKFCRKGYLVSSGEKLTDEFLMLLWIKQPRGGIEISSMLGNDLRSALSSTFSLQANQIARIIFHNQSDSNNFLVASFRLTLTPFQSLIMANQRNSNFNVTRENTAFLKLLNLTGNLTLASTEYSFSVVKVISKSLSCYKAEKFQPDEYKIDRENDTFIVNKTGEVFSLEDHTLVEEDGGNVTLCRQLVLSDCNGSAFVQLAPNEYVIFPNLSVYYNATESIFNFGEYLIGESLNQGSSDISDINLNLLKNATISVCSAFSDAFNGSETKYTSSSTTSYGVRILTLIGFSVSIMCLMLLLITYGLFQELRTLPGMNLMNLCFSMVLADLVWLIGTANFTGTTTCKVFAVLGHYFFQVSFVAMSVISYHSCRAFSQPFVGRVAHKSWRKFAKYSALVWLIPAIFVAVCLSLDKTEAFLVDYGTHCWLGTANARLYLFLLPLAMLLLYNVYTFIRTAVSLSRHEKERQTALQRKEGKQNLVICSKLATLVGFPWLFAFFVVLFPGVEAFEYLFVVFVCLQGLYIGMAFLFNKKTLKLYKDRFIGSKGVRSSKSASTIEMTR